VHVGLVIYGSLDTLSGGFLYDRQLVEHLRQAGHTVGLMSLPWRNYRSHLLDNLRPGLLHHLRASPYDILLQDELNHPSLFLLNRGLKPHVSYPVVSIVHHLRSSEQHPAALRPLYRWVERQYLRTVDAFVYNSQTTRHVVEAVLRASPPHVVAMPSGSRFTGMSTASITQRAREDRPLRVVFVGNLIPRKGLHTLLDAVARLPAEAAQLTAIGDTATNPAYVRAIRQRIKSLNLEAQVELTGKLSRAALGEHLAAADVLAVPSQYEGFGIVYLEGMAFGLPAIATTSGAAKEIITSQTDGFLIPPEDAAALANRLLALASDRELLREMSLAARRRFDAHPTWDDTTARIETFLTGITA